MYEGIEHNHGDTHEWSSLHGRSIEGNVHAGLEDFRPTVPDGVGVDEFTEEPLDTADVFAEIPNEAMPQEPDGSEQSEQLVEKQVTHVAEGAGSLAVSDITPPSAEAASEDPPVSTMDDIRTKYRAGAIAIAGQAPRSEFTGRYGGILTEVYDMVDTWLAQQPADATMASAVALKFKTSWFKSYGKAEQQPTLDETQQALAELYDDAQHIHVTHKISAIEAPTLALLNSRQEIDAAFTIATEAGIRSSGMQIVAEHGFKADILAGARAACANLDAITDAIESGRLAPDHIDDTTRQRYAYRTGDPEVCLRQIEQYQQNVHDLRASYPDEDTLPLWRIKDACRKSPDPAGLLKNKMRIIQELTDEYEGVEGISDADIANLAFGCKDPRAKIEECLAQTPAVSNALGGRFDTTTVRHLIMRYKDPVAAGQRTIARTEQLKAALAHNPDSVVLRDSHYAKLLEYGDRAVQMGGIFARKLATAKMALRDDDRITEAMFTHAALQSAPVLDTLRGMVGTLQDLQIRYGNQHIRASIYQKAVLIDDPDTYMRDFITMRHKAFQAYASTFPLAHVHEVLSSHAKPLRKLEADAAAIASAKERYGHLASLTDIAVGTFINNAGNARYAATRAYATAVFEDMRISSFDDHRRGLGKHIRSGPMAQAMGNVLTLAVKVLQDKLPLTVTMSMATTRIQQLYVNYRNQTGHNLLDTPKLLEAVCDEYARYTTRLSNMGVDVPHLVAATTNERQLMRYMTAHIQTDKDIRQIIHNRGGAIDAVAAYKQYRTAYTSLRQEYAGVILGNVIKSVCIDSPTPAQDLATFAAKLRELPAQFAGQAAATARVLRHAGSYFTNNPAALVDQYLQRREAILLQAPLGPDMNEHVAETIGLAVRDIAAIPAAVELFKQRLILARQAAAQDNIDVPDSTLMQVAARPAVRGRSMLQSILRSQKTIEGYRRMPLGDYRNLLKQRATERRQR